MNSAEASRRAARHRLAPAAGSAAARWTTLLEQRAALVDQVWVWQASVDSNDIAHLPGDGGRVAQEHLDFAKLALRDFDAKLEAVDARAGGSKSLGDVKKTDHLGVETDQVTSIALDVLVGVLRGEMNIEMATSPIRRLLSALHIAPPKKLDELILRELRAVAPRGWKPRPLALTTRAVTTFPGALPPTKGTQVQAYRVLHRITGYKPETLKSWAKGKVGAKYRSRY